jgi:lipoate-protein ligase A
MDMLSYPHPDIRWHMAADEALVRAAEDGEARESLRFYEFDDVSVVLGVGAKWREEVFPERCEADDVPVLRRCSGGGTVLFAPGCLGYSLVLDTEARPELADLHASYRAILDRLVLGFRSLGIEARHAGICDLALGELKFGGSAQKRLQRCILHHGTILYDMDLSLIDRYLPHPPDEPDYRAGRPHSEFVTNVPLPAADCRRAVTRAFFPPGQDPQPRDVGTNMLKDARELLVTRYETPQWHRRR